jgi:peroxisomal 2,4-dienoyl-CoA reductase
MLITHRTSRLDRLEASAKELSEKTGQKCLPIQGDVRNPTTLQAAAKRTVEEFGKIDFVICGMLPY